MKRGRVRRSVKALERFAVSRWKLCGDGENGEFLEVKKVLRGYARAMLDMGEFDAFQDAEFLAGLAFERYLLPVDLRGIVVMPQFQGVGGCYERD